MMGYRNTASARARSIRSYLLSALALAVGSLFGAGLVLAASASAA